MSDLNNLVPNHTLKENRVNSEESTPASSSSHCLVTAVSISDNTYNNHEESLPTEFSDLQVTGKGYSYNQCKDGEHYDNQEEYYYEGEEEEYYDDQGDYYYQDEEGYYDEEEEETASSSEKSESAVDYEGIDEEAQRLFAEIEAMKAMGLPTEFGASMLACHKTSSGKVGKVAKSGNRQQRRQDNANFQQMFQDWSGRASELSFEELQNFDFRFIPDRDFAFIARKAKKFFDNKSFLKKYWNQRYTYFSKLDDGILMDRESWFSVTPEKIAKHIASRLVKEKDTVILDGFCGAGGNSIQFALKGAIVYAVDLDPMKLRFALENAKIYGVADRINFICGNFFHIAESLIGSQSTKKEKFSPIDVVFLSPPWGGPSYLKKKIFNLEKMTPNGFEIFEIARQISPNIAYFLPRNTCTTQLTSLAGPDGKVEIEQCLVEYKKPKKHIKESTFSDDPDENVESNQEKEEELVQKCKSLTVYYGNLVAESDPKMKRIPKPDDFIEGTLTSNQLNEPMIENLEENSEKSSDKYNDDELWDNRDII